jgi:hypothetical protein
MTGREKEQAELQQIAERRQAEFVAVSGRKTVAGKYQSRETP